MPPKDCSDPAAVVQRQLDTYNARDIEAFMALWAEDARLYEFPDTLLAEGAAAIRERHLGRFAEPNLHARLIHRTVMGDKVIDQEIVDRTFPEGPGTLEVVVIYQVTAGLITASWALPGRRALHQP